MRGRSTCYLSRDQRIDATNEALAQTPSMRRIARCLQVLCCRPRTRSFLSPENPGTGTDSEACQFA